MRVLVAERIAEDGIEILKESFDVDVKIGLSHEQLLDIIADYDAIIVRSATQVDAELIERAANLKVAGRAGTGVDNIDVDAATRKGIVVVNTPDGNSMAAAELAVGLAFCIFRSIPQAFAYGKAKDFRRNKFKGYELHEKTAGIVGLGRIGSLVAERLKGMGMRVIGYDPYVPEDRYKRLGVERCDKLEDLLSQADLVTIHMAKTEQTTNMIDEQQFKVMKKGIRIVNAARGGIINERALYNAIREGIVAGAALDVLEEEPNFELKPEEQNYRNPLLELDNVIYVPHLGASTQEAQYNVGVMIAKQVAAVLKGEMVAAVNMPAIPKNQLEEMRPYLQLAEDLGGIYYQGEKEVVEKLEIVYSGDLAEKETKVLTYAVLKGFLQQIVEDRVNYVNAETLAGTIGVTFTESKSRHLEKYTNLITVKFITKNKVQAVSGTVFAKEELRIVDFFGYKLDFEPTPYVIAIQNIDRPGIIGKIGTTLGNHNINIAAMQWSRNRKGEKAVAFVSVDGEVPPVIMEKVRSIEGVLKATMLLF